MARRLWLCFGLVLAVVGCGGSSGPTLYPLTGVVLVDGQPLAYKQGQTAFLEFHPDKSAGNETTALPRSPIAGDGTYELYTNGVVGVPAGAWLVRVVHQVEPTPGGKNMYAEPKTLILPKYNTPTTSDLKIEIKSDGPRTHEFKVTKAP